MLPQAQTILHVLVEQTTTKVTSSEIAKALKSLTSSNVQYVYMLFFHSLQQCTNNVHFRRWVILEPHAISTSKFYN